MIYTIYQITNKINRKIYIGKHQTKDLNDGYMGSGKHLRRAIEKYGIENFEKEILFQFDNENEMNEKEAELVTEEFCLREYTYNLCPGGKGGWGYINANGLTPVNDGSERHRERTRRAGLNTIEKLLEKFNDADFYNMWRKSLIGRPPTKGTTGLKFSEETRLRMSSMSSGAKNSQYGSMWITDGFNNKKIRKEDSIPEGWYKGRKLKQKS
jgi:hypothetical protein